MILIMVGISIFLKTTRGTNFETSYLERKKKGWEYKDEETLESDGFDIFDSMFEILENNLNK